MNGIKLISTGSAVPKKVVTNDDLAKIVDTNDEWISTRTGIRSRRYCTDGESHSDRDGHAYDNLLFRLHRSTPSIRIIR